MEKRLRISIESLLKTSVLLILLISCQDDDPMPPELSSSPVTNITYTTAVSGGNISSDGGSSISSRGVCWSINPNPTIADGKTTDGGGAGSFTSNITGLTADTKYFLRSYATSSGGTSYGNEIEFTTPPTSVTDIDGNVYQTVIIGTQVWLAENLKTTKYQNGDPIPDIPDDSEWASLEIGAYAVHSNISANQTTYGNLYNCFAVIDNRNIAPDGWHVPSQAEWTTLQEYLGGELTAGGKLKEIGLSHWESPNDGATNETGFTALPGGYRDANGSFSNLGYMGVWWSRPTIVASTAFSVFTYMDGPELHSEPNDRKLGFSVRCIMD